MYLVLDLETVPDPSLWVPPVDKPDAFPPPYAHRIVCVGLFRLDGRYRPLQLVANVSDDEDALLDRLSRYVEACRAPTIVTFNGRTFDMPVIAMRSMRHGISIPWYYTDRDVRYRFSERGHLDILDALTDYGAATKLTLDAACRLIGMPGKDEIDGSDVARLFAARRFAEIERYCMSDVVRTAMVLIRFRLLQGAITQDEYDAASAALQGFGAPAIPSDPIGAAKADSAPASALPGTGELFTSESA